jgi:hypothetical protein
MNDEDGHHHLMMWIDKCKKTKRNQVVASTGKSRCKEKNGPVVEEGRSKRDQEAGDCSLDLVTPCMLFVAIRLLIYGLLITQSSC